jgi:hypothetical protein
MPRCGSTSARRETIQPSCAQRVLGPRGRGDGAGGEAAAVDLDSPQGLGEPVDESVTDLVALAEDLELDGQAVLALLPDPLVVEPFDRVVERPQLVAAASRDVQRVKDGLGPVSAQGDRVGGVLDEPELDRVGDWSSSFGSFGAGLVRSLHPQVLRHERRRSLVERVPLAGDLEHDVHSPEPISAIGAAL